MAWVGGYLLKWPQKDRPAQGTGNSETMARVKSLRSKVHGQELTVHARRGKLGGHVPTVPDQKFMEKVAGKFANFCSRSSNALVDKKCFQLADVSRFRTPLREDPELGVNERSRGD